MDEIFFPPQYKNALVNKTKNMTIRISDEIGKYKVGKTYIAKSYAGKIWGIKIKILKISLTTLNKLSEYGIPKQSIEAIKRKGYSSNTKAELINFKIKE